MNCNCGGTFEETDEGHRTPKGEIILIECDTCGAQAEVHQHTNESFEAGTKQNGGKKDLDTSKCDVRHSRNASAKGNSGDMK